MNIHWEEHDSADEKPKHWSEEGSGKKPEFKKAGYKVDGSVDLSEDVMNDTETAFVYDIKTPPTFVGGYDITGGNGIENSFVFNFVKKPSWFHRTCCRFFLGWRWHDKKQEKKSGLLLG